MIRRFTEISREARPMAMLFDFFPVLLFFLVFKVAGIYWATGVIIVASLLQVAVTWVRNRTVKPIHVITAVLVVVFGGLTLWIHDPLFIKWKPSAVYWLLGAILVVSQWRGRPAIKRLLESQLSLPDFVWARLNGVWAAFFMVVGVVNIYVAYAFDTATWVNFKVFGLLGITLLFGIGQALYIARYLPKEDAS